VSEQSAIEWTDATWNPVTGCTKVSPGCAHCYIERTPPFRMAGRRFVRGAIPVLLHPDRLDQPLRWRKPRRVFVCSLADLFHEDVPFAFIARIWRVMNTAREHTFQLLTKRPHRMLEFLRWLEAANWERVAGAEEAGTWPLPNVWLGVSVENQRMADERIPVLLDTPAAVRFLSCEPLLGPLDLSPWLERRVLHSPDLGGVGTNSYAPRVSWVIVGGESGPGSAERKLVERCDGRKHGGFGCEHCGLSGWRPKPQALEWVRSLRDQCVAAGTAFHLKQLGGPRPTSGGRSLDGRTWDEMPVKGGG